MKKVKLIFFLVLCACAHSIDAQRHYAGVSALEMNYGMNIFGGQNHNANLSYSKYRNRTTYWKVGLNYFEKSFNYNSEDIALDVPAVKTDNRIARDYYLDGVFSKTVATNLSSLYFNLGLGAFTGVEIYKKEEQEHKFLLGPKIEAELEYFVSGRVALLARVKQSWSPFSKIDKWNTVWNFGVKLLIY